MQENIARSKEKTVLVAACIYLACRLEGYPRLLEEVSAWCFVSIDELMKMQSKIARKLELTCPIISAKDLVNRFVFQLGSWPHSYSYIRKALDVCQSIEEYELYPSLPPQQIAAGVIVWIALLEDFAQIDIQRLCEVSHISMNQLKAFYQLSHKMIANLVPVDLLDKCQHMTSYPMTLDKCLRSGTTVLKSNRDGMEAIAVKAEPVQDTITTPKSASSVSNATTTMLSNNSLTSKIRKRKTISTNEVLASTSSPVAIKEEEDITSMVDEDHLPTMKKPRID